MDERPVPLDPVSDIPTLDVRDSVPWFVLLLLVYVLAGFYAMGLGAGPVISAFFGAGTLWALYRILRRRPRLRITEEGIIDRTYWYSPGLIRWEEIIDVRKTRWGWVEIDLLDEASVWDRLPPWKTLPRAMWPLYGIGPAAFNPLFLEGSRTDLVEAMQAGLDAYTLAQARCEPVLEEGDPARPRLRPPETG